MLKSRRAWALAITAVAAVMVAWSGRGGEAQFSPDTFESRGVNYFYVPHTDLAVLSLPGGGTWATTTDRPSGLRSL